MKIISHRGNLTGTNTVRENSIEYIEEAIAEGFDIEIDLWYKEHNYYLGHDEPQYHAPMSWLVKHKDVLWIHCKNREALEKLSDFTIEFNYFWHENDSYTLTSKCIGWVLIGQQPYSKSVIVLPEVTNLLTEYIQQSYGICTDFPLFYRNKFGVSND